MNAQTKLHLWHIFNHLLAILGLILIIQSNSYYWLVYSYLMYIIIGMLGVNIGLHRYLSHRSFKTGIKRDIFLKYISILSGLGSPIVWVAMHRHHHATSDTDKDIQAPKNIGFLRAWFLHYKTASFSPSTVRDVISCRHNKFIHKHYFKILFFIYTTISLINPLYTIYLFAIPAVLCFHGAAALGVLNHTFGYKVATTKDNSYNNILASIVSLGEGWHNYHHAYPGDYKQGHQWFEFDPTARCIELAFKV